MNTLSINFYAKNIKKDALAEFHSAIDYENADMNIQLLDTDISRLETRITTFSLPFETPYTDKTRVKLTADDKKLLNDCYIKGFSNKFNTDEDTGKVTFKKRQINTLVKAKKNRKTGKIEYDYSGLASTIANIVIKHYFA